MILEIVSPEASLFKGKVNSVAVPGVDGDFQMLNNHAAIVSTLTNGNIRIEADNFVFFKETASKFSKETDQKYSLAITSGTLELKDNQIIILVD